MAREALTKGVGFVNVRAFVTERHGEEAWEQILADLTPEEREQLSAVLPVGWYSLALYAKLIRIVDDRLGGSDLRLVQTLGRFEAERDLTTVQQYFLRLIRPSIVFEQTGKYWRRFHDTGEWEIQRTGDREVVGVLSGWGVVDGALCRELVGYLGRTLELCGAVDVWMDHPHCRARGDAACEFRVRWRQKRDAPGEPFGSATS